MKCLRHLKMANHNEEIKWYTLYGIKWEATSPTLYGIMWKNVQRQTDTKKYFGLLITTITRVADFKSATLFYIEI